MFWSSHAQAERLIQTYDIAKGPMRDFKIFPQGSWPASDSRADPLDIVLRLSTERSSWHQPSRELDHASRRDAFRIAPQHEGRSLRRPARESANSSDGDLGEGSSGLVAARLCLDRLSVLQARQKFLMRHRFGEHRIVLLDSRALLFLAEGRRAVL